MVFTISRELHDRLLAEAAASPDVEICGLLIGDVVGDIVVEHLVPTSNVADDPARAFEIDPAALFTAIRAERSGQGRVLGYYHSHPVGAPSPSKRDEEQATIDGRIWLIIGQGQMRAWRIMTSGNFVAIDMEVME